MSCLIVHLCAYFQVSSVKPTAHVGNHYTVMVIIQAFLQQET